MKEDQNTKWEVSWHDEHLEWLCGFANTRGGVLEVGRNDEGQVVGIEDAERLLEELPNKLRDLLGIIADIELLEEGGRSYLRIVIEPYPVPISYRGEYHYRSGATKQVLRGAALDLPSTHYSSWTFFSLVFRICSATSYPNVDFDRES